MFAITRILCAVDLSATSKIALRWAYALAREHDAGLRVLHVVADDPPGGDRPAASIAARRVDREEDLNWFVASIADASVPAVLDVRDGPVAATILATADDYRSDAIVVGATGAGAAPDRAVGVVTADLVERALCPLFVVPAGPSTVSPGPVRLVVLPTDFSRAAAAAREHAQCLAAATPGAAVLVAHVNEPVAGEDGDAASRRGTETEARLRSEFADMETPAQFAVLDGEPAGEIVRAARERRATVIVMVAPDGDRREPSPAESTTVRVLADAPCPVLVVPAPGRQAAPYNA